MTAVFHNSSEDVTFLTDEQALWAARVREARFSYTSEDCLLWTFWPVLIGIQKIFVLDCECVCVRARALQSEGQIQQDN